MKDLFERRYAISRRINTSKRACFCTFHDFPNLPPGFQKKIWQYSLPGPFKYGFSAILKIAISLARLSPLKDDPVLI